MSGIACFVRWEGGLVVDAMAPMFAAMRGRVVGRAIGGVMLPDASPLAWTDGVAAFGHTAPRSDITDTISGIATSPAAAVCFTGRVHHATDLMRRIQFTHDAATPAALVLAAFEKYGNDCLRYIDGDFAVMIWDRSARQLSFARDRAGSRPLAWMQTHQGVLVASDTQAIRAMLPVAPAVDEQRLADYLADNIGDTNATFYNGIERVPSATLISVRKQNVARNAYWVPDRGVSPDSVATEKSVRDDVEKFRTLFDDAVRQRMPHGANIGVSLSGGLDSSSVMCVAARAREGDGARAPIGISAIYDTLPQCDERLFIEQVSEATSTEHCYIAVDDCNPLAYSSEIIECHDEPPRIPNLFMQWRGLMPTARAAGVDVMLDGIEGDTVVSEGEGRIHDLLWSLQLRTLWRDARAPNRSATQALRVVMEEGVKPKIPRFLRVMRRALTNPATLPPYLLRKDVRKRAGVYERALQTEKLHASARNDADAHWFSVTAGLNSYVLEILERSAAVHGIELAHPFYDHRLVDHCVGLASDRKMRNGETRWILREAMTGTIPAGIRHRQTKSNLRPCFEQGLRVYDSKRAPDMLRQHRDRLAAFVDLDVLDAVLGRFVTAPRPFDGLAVWKTALLGEWLAYTERS